MNIESIRARNFRAFVDTGPIALKKINLLVGKNSIGKSSFARIWPLFAQAEYATKRTPVLWNGNLVDFGNFSDALSRYATESTISFDFALKKEPAANQLKSRISFISYIDILSDNPLHVSIDINAVDGRTVCKKLSILTCDHEITYHYNSDGIFDGIDSSIDGESPRRQKYNLSRYAISTPPSFIAPIPDFYIKDGDSAAWSPMHMRLYSMLRRHLHQRISKDKIHEICMRLNIIGHPSDIIEFAKTLPFNYVSWDQFLSLMESNKRILNEFAELVNISSSELLLRDIDKDIKSYFSRVNYIQPLRATAQRYYRKQELAVENIDPTGSNLAFFLSSLKSSEIAHLNDWLSDSLEINIETEDNTGHVSVKITDITTGRKDNMADMGFGFSQVLPLAIQAWIAMNNRDRATERILVWEQPELHLHPAMQRKLARLIGKLINQSGECNIKLVAETHSQSMLNEFGDLIECENISHDDIQVLLFEQLDNGDTSIKSTSFDDEGQLNDWPYGFLSV